MTNMKLFRFSFLLLALTVCVSFTVLIGPPELPLIKAVELPKVDTRTFQDGGEEIGRPWCTISPAIGENMKASSFLKPSGEITYDIDKATDCDIYTAWVEGKADYGKGEYLEFKVNAGRIEEDALWMFNGKCEMQNGYAKSEKSWKENSRVKKLKIYHNNSPLCIIQLVDSRKIQTFDMSKFFDLSEMELISNDADGNEISILIKGSAAENYNTNKWNEGAAIKLKKGDILKFEILDVYPGLKWKDTAITELRGGK